MVYSSFILVEAHWAEMAKTCEVAVTLKSFINLLLRHKAYVSFPEVRIKVIDFFRLYFFWLTSKTTLHFMLCGFEYCYMSGTLNNRNENLIEITLRVLERTCRAVTSRQELFEVAWRRNARRWNIINNVELKQHKGLEEKTFVKYLQDRRLLSSEAGLFWPQQSLSTHHSDSP